MYNHKELIDHQKKIEQSLIKLLNNSKMICSENIQKTISTHLKSLSLSIDAMNAAIETIFLMNQWGKSVHELFSEYPEEYVPADTAQRNKSKK